MRPEIFDEPVLLWLGPVPITPTMLTSLATTATLLVVFGVVARAVQAGRSSYFCPRCQRRA